MRYGGCTDVRTHNKIVPLYTLVWGSLRLAPIRIDWTGIRQPVAIVLTSNIICFCFLCDGHKALYSPRALGTKQH